MTPLARLGCILIGLAVTALGIQSVWLRIYVGRLQPIPKWVPCHEVIAVATGVFLLLVGLAILSRKWARLAATALSAMVLLWVSVLHVSRIFREPAAWLGTFETFAIFGGTWLLAATLPIDGKPRAWDAIVDRGEMLGRLCFGVSLP